MLNEEHLGKQIEVKGKILSVKDPNPNQSQFVFIHTPTGNLPVLLSPPFLNNSNEGKEGVFIGIVKRSKEGNFYLKGQVKEILSTNPNITTPSIPIDYNAIVVALIYQGKDIEEIIAFLNKLRSFYESTSN